MNRIKASISKLLSGQKPDFVLWCFPLIGLLILCLIPFLVTGNIFDPTATTQGSASILVGPAIALLAALLTFVCFWIQVQANKERSIEIDQQETDLRTDRFENRFYEMLKIHRNNVSEINISNAVHNRKAFISMFDEFKFCYHSLKQLYTSLIELKIIQKKLNEQDLVNISYSIFFLGIGNNSGKLTEELVMQYETPLIDKYLACLKKLQKKHQEEGHLSTTTSKKTFSIKLGYKPFCGHISWLGHYYRHLFQTVKFIADQDDRVIKGKYEYLKTLRAQLSSHEQLLLYYNGLTSLGKSWIENKYFTEYRMISNLPLPLADFGERPKDKFGDVNSKGEPLFEWDEIMFRNKVFYHAGGNGQTIKQSDRVQK